MTAALEVKDLRKRYRETVALAGVTFDVREGELVGLLGPNGAGKSTLVKIACGLVHPTGGSAAIFGNRPGTREALRVLGYLAELFRFPPWLSVDEVLQMHQKLAASDGDARERRGLLKLVNLSSVATRRVGDLSKGMQQRLGIAQALIGSPRLLLLDEPTSALDPAGRRAIREVLVGIRDRGIAVLLNSHLLGEVEIVCDRVVILLNGAVVAQGEPQTLAGERGVEVETDAGLRTFPNVSRSEVPELVARLVREGLGVYGVRPVRSTLEDVYMDAVGGATG
jgi:ABC-2 type transport system ATP-binding protein